MNKVDKAMTASDNNGARKSWEIRIGGVGGQGIVLSSKLLGIAASLYDGKEAVVTQSYGPEARGGAARSDVVISEDAVDYPFVIQADVLAALFPEAYTKFRPILKEGGTLIVDSALVKVSEEDEASAIMVPATKIADEVGNRLTRNVVILGCLVGATGVVSREAMVQAIHKQMKEKIVEVNIKALDAGIEFARNSEAS